MAAWRECVHAVVCQASRTTPDDHIAVMDLDPPHSIAARLPAPHEGRVYPKRNRHDRLIEIPLVTILVKRQSRAGFVAVHEARFRREPLESHRSRGALRQVCEHRGHRRPSPMS